MAQSAVQTQVSPTPVDAAGGEPAPPARSPDPVIEASATEVLEQVSVTDDRQHRVEVAAYFIAEHRGFAPGHELDDWLAAEAEISRTDPSAGESAPGAH